MTGLLARIFFYMVVMSVTLSAVAHAQFSGNLAGVSGVSGLPPFNPADFNVPPKHPIKEALAEAIVLNAEAKKAKHTKDTPASPSDVPVAPSAKTKSFAYTSISVPSSTTA